jgi:hypothetical protein
MLALLVFSAFVVDYGVMWVARSQAQNAADAGALAGAIEKSEGSSTDNVKAAAGTAAEQPSIWGQQTADADVIVTHPFDCPASAGPADPNCVRVDVMRGVPDRDGNAHTNFLPTFFAQMVGITSQGVRATATAQVAAGNGVKCLQPYIIPDKWIDNNEAPIGGWSQNDTFTPPPDVYRPPSDPQMTGFTLADVGTEMVLKTAGTNWASGWSQLIDFGNGNGANVLPGEINCDPALKSQTVGLYNPDVAGACNVQNTPTNPAAGCVSIKPGINQGPFSSGIGTLVGSDSGAHWDTSCNCVLGSSASGLSPRVVPVAVFDSGQFYTENPTGNGGGSNTVARVVNIFGFFIEGMCDTFTPSPPVTCTSSPQKDLVGRIMALPGEFISSAGGAPGPASFIKIIRLVH